MSPESRPEMDGGYAEASAHSATGLRLPGPTAAPCPERSGRSSECAGVVRPARARTLRVRGDPPGKAPAPCVPPLRLALVAKRKWSDLTVREKRAIYAGGVVELVVTAAALRDLVGRPADDVRGSKAAWAGSFVVQPFGPLAYFAWGRRSHR